MNYVYIKLFNIKKNYILFKNSFFNMYTNIFKLVLYEIIVLSIAAFNALVVTNKEFIYNERLYVYNLTVIALFEILILIVAAIKISKPKRYDDFLLAFKSIGMVNSIDIPPIPIKCRKNKDGTTIYKFYCPSFTLSCWRDKQEELQSAMNIFIIGFYETERKDFVEMKYINKNAVLPANIEWNFADDMNFEIYDSFVVNLGKNQMGHVSINLMKTPHILLAGSSGYGKSVQLTSIIYQCEQKGAKVFIVDPKNSNDFNYIDECTTVTTISEALEITDYLFQEIERRKIILKDAKVANVNEYNRLDGKFLCRIILAIDETSLIFDTTGMDKKDKEITTKLIRNITNLCRVARAYNIHIILCTQRPSVESIPGTIKANMSARICGYMPDKYSSETILDDGSAANLPAIPGRFILKSEDGTNVVYQAFNMSL